MEAAQLLTAALPAAWTWALAAFWAAFWALRLTMYTILVSAAWIRIIEGDSPGHHAARRPPRHPPPASPARSEVSDSIADWSIWDSESDLGDVESLEGSVEGEAAAAPPATPAARPMAAPPQAVLPAAAPATPTATVVARAVPRPPVSASAVPTPPAQQQSSLAEEVLPEEVAELAADREEKQDLATAAVAGDAMAGASIAVEGHGRHGHHGRRRKAKKPWLNRKIEGLFKPYSEKTHAAGIMIYKGLGRMGKQMERGAGTLGKRLDGAIRDAGAEAALEIELLVQKWVKFAGVVALLTVALMPLPSVYVTLSMGQPVGTMA